jgi:hypothetical protein
MCKFLDAYAACGTDTAAAKVSGTGARAHYYRLQKI